jgi:hypothetical protein
VRCDVSDPTPGIFALRSSGFRGTGLFRKYERDYNIFNLANRYAPDSQLNAVQTYAPNNPFNPLNRFDRGDPANPDQPIQLQ